MSPGPLLFELFAPGFFSSAPVRTALIVGGVAAVVSAVVGVFTVARGQSFAGHSLADIGAAGGSAAVLLYGTVSALYGFVAMNVLAAGVMETIGIRRPRGRDLATGIVLAAALGFAALFLFLTTTSPLTMLFITTSRNTSGASASVLFGSIFAFDPSLVPTVVVIGVLAVAGVLALYRPLMLSSLSPDLAATRGVPVRIVSLSFLVALALAVSLSAVTVGAILSTALLVGPAATALRVSDRAGTAMIVAALLGVGETWLGILLAYDSYGWFPGHSGAPVSFLVVSIAFVVYIAADLILRRPRTMTAI